MKKIFNLFNTNTHKCVSSYTSGLISHNEEPPEKDLKEFFKAASKGDLTKLKRLDIRTDVAQLNKQTSDAFHVACARGHAEVVHFLLERKAEVNVYDDRKRSALMKAVQGQHKQCVKILLEHGAEPDMPDVGGNTALHCAAKNPPISIAVLLLKHKADINIQNKKGFTPLTVAVRDNHIKMAETLLQQNADVNITDQDRKSPLMIAASKGQMHMLQLLMHFNADITLKDIKGWSAHDYASKNGFFRCLPLLSKLKDGQIKQYEDKPQLKRQHKKIPVKKEEALKRWNEESDPEDTSQSETEECWNSSENDEEETPQNTNPPGLLRSSSNFVNKDKKLRGSENKVFVLNKYAKGDGTKNPFSLGSTNDQDGACDGRNNLVEVVDFSDWDSLSVDVKPEEKVIDSVSNNERKQKTELPVCSDAELSDWDSPSGTSPDDTDEVTGREADKALRVLNKHENEVEQRTDLGLGDVEKRLSSWDTLTTRNFNDNVKDKPRKSGTMSKNFSCQERNIKTQQPVATTKSRKESGQSHLPPRQKPSGKKQEGQTETLELEQFNVGHDHSLKVQVSALMFQLADMKTHLENERQSRETLEAQLVSTCARLVAAVKEAERCLAAQADAEKALVREKEEHQVLRDSLVHAGNSESEERVKVLEKKNKDLTSAAAVLQARIFKLEEEKIETEADVKHLADLLPKHLRRICEGNNEKSRKLKQMKDVMEILKEEHCRFGVNLAKANCFMMDDQQSFTENLSLWHLDCEETDGRKKLDDLFQRFPMGDAAIEVNMSSCRDLEEEMTRLLELMEKANNVLGESKDPDTQTDGHSRCLKSPGDEVDRSRTIKELEEAVEELTRKKSRLSDAGLGEGKHQQRKKKKKSVVQGMEGNSDLRRRCDVSKAEGEDVVFPRNNRSVDSKSLTECGRGELTDKVERLSQKKMESAVSRCSQLEKANRELKSQLDTLKTFCCNKVQRERRNSEYEELYRNWQRENVPLQQNQREPYGFNEEKWTCQKIQYNLKQTDD